MRSARKYRPKDVHTNKKYQHKPRNKKPAVKKTYGGR